MPWHWEPKKDVTSCDKLRGAANKLIRRFPNEETHRVEDAVSIHEYIVYRGELGELKHLINRRKRKKESIPLVVVSERGGAQTLCRDI